MYNVYFSISSPTEQSNIFVSLFYLEYKNSPHHKNNLEKIPCLNLKHSKLHNKPRQGFYNFKTSNVSKDDKVIWE